MGSTQSPIQRRPWVISPSIKQPEREADHLALSTAEVKNSGDIISVLMAQCLIKRKIILSFV
jgi:hypothetical protein